MEGKKIFTLYTDLIKIANGSNDHDVEIEAMTDEELGKLFRWILEYVNDYKPSVPKEIKYQVAFIKKQLDADLEKYKEKCKKNSDNVKKRWNTTEKECIQNDTTVYDRIRSDTNYTDKDKDKDKDTDKDINNTSVINNTCSKSTLSGGVLEEKFNRFWSEYPKKVGKDKCLKWFKQHKVDDELLNKMLDTVRKFKNSTQWCKDNGQYIPHPYTWLNRGGWEDELKEDAFTSSNNIEVVWEEL